MKIIISALAVGFLFSCGPDWDCGDGCNAQVAESLDGGGVVVNVTVVVEDNDIVAVTDVTNVDVDVEVDVTDEDGELVTDAGVVDSGVVDAGSSDGGRFIDAGSPDSGTCHKCHKCGKKTKCKTCNSGRHLGECKNRHGVLHDKCGRAVCP